MIILAANIGKEIEEIEIVPETAPDRDVPVEPPEAEPEPDREPEPEREPEKAPEKEKGPVPA